MKELHISSTIDYTMQPNLFYEAIGRNRPLLVGLHTWSHDRFNLVENLLPLAKKNDWNLLLPEFRGPNTKNNIYSKDACGSQKAKQDIIDAVSHVKDNYQIDENNILLLGASGGGHMSLLMAAYKPELWKIVCSFVPITDIEKWYFENLDYREHIEACCGRKNEKQHEYWYRSPINYIDEIAKATVKIYSGKWDNIVPCHHGLDIYNKIFEKFPKAKVYFEMFDGGHEMNLEEAERCLLAYVEDNRIIKKNVTG